MDLLPQECLDYIVSLSDVASLGRLALTCHRLRNFILSPRYWQNVDLSYGSRGISSSFFKTLAQYFGDTVKVLNLKNTTFQQNVTAHVPKRILLDEEDRYVTEYVVINQMFNKANNILSNIKIHTEDGNSALFNDLQVRQARALLWDALWIALANKHGEKFVLEKEKYFQNIYHNPEWSTRILSLLSKTEEMLLKPTNLFPRLISVPSRDIHVMTFITDPRNNKTYLAVGHERQILLWEPDTLQHVKTFDLLAPTKAVTKLRNYHDWTHILVCFYNIEQPILIGGTTRGCFCWNFDTSELLYEKKCDVVNPMKSYVDDKTAATRYAVYKDYLLVRSKDFECTILEAHTGKLVQEVVDSIEDNGYVNFSPSNGKFLRITEIPGLSTTLTLTIVDLFSELREVKCILPGEFKHKRVYFECDTYEDELIAVNCGLSELTIYRRAVDKAGTIDYKEVQSIKLSQRAKLIKILSQELVLADNQIYNIDTGQLQCNVGALQLPNSQSELYRQTRPSPLAFSERTGMFAIAENSSVISLFRLADQKQLIDPIYISPDKFSRSRDALFFHEKYNPYITDFQSSYIPLKFSPCDSNSAIKSKMLPLDYTFTGIVDHDGILIDITQDKYALTCQLDDARCEVFKVIDLDTKTVLWQTIVTPRQGSHNTEGARGALFVPNTDHVIVRIPGGGYTLSNWKTNQVIESKTHSKFGESLKASRGGRYYVMSTSVGYTRTLVFDRVENSLFLPDTHTNGSEALDFNPANEYQLAIAGCGVRIFDLQSKVQCKVLTRFVDGQVNVLRECEEIPLVKYSPSGKYLAVIELPSRKPWGLCIAPSILRVYETEQFKMITSLDLGETAKSLYWFDDEHALIGGTDGKLMQLKIVVPEFAQYFEYIIPPRQGTIKLLLDVTSWLTSNGPYKIGDVSI